MPGRSVRRPRAATALVAAALPLALLTGCSEEIEPRFPDENESSSASASPSGPAEPTPPAAMKGSGEAAAKAFVRYYFEQLTYATLSGRTDSVKSMAAKDCASCTGAVEAIERIYERDGAVKGGAMVAQNVRVRAQSDSNAPSTPYEGTAELRVSRQVIRNTGDKKLDGPSEAATVRLVVHVAHSPAGWRMTEWSQP